MRVDEGLRKAFTSDEARLWAEPIDIQKAIKSLAIKSLIEKNVSGRPQRDTEFCTSSFSTGTRAGRPDCGVPNGIYTLYRVRCGGAAGRLVEREWTRAWGRLGVASR